MQASASGLGGHRAPPPLCSSPPQSQPSVSLAGREGSNSLRKRVSQGCSHARQMERGLSRVPRRRQGLQRAGSWSTPGT